MKALNIITIGFYSVMFTNFLVLAIVMDETFWKIIDAHLAGLYLALLVLRVMGILKWTTEDTKNEINTEEKQLHGKGKV